MPNYLDLAATIAWGVLLLKYAIDGTLYILVHPSYYTLVALTGGCLLAIGLFQSWRLYQSTRKSRPLAIDRIGCNISVYSPKE
jgi:uncharacterized membrane protein YcgQ (UPF0703/DUF1980 family)